MIDAGAGWAREGNLELAVAEIDEGGCGEVGAEIRMCDDEDWERVVKDRDRSASG